MRRVLGVLFALCLIAVPVEASPLTAAGPGPGGFASDNLEWIKFFPLHTDSAGGALVGKYFYITTERDLTIYDTSDPVNPVEVGRTLLVPPGDFYTPEEDPETNGKVLLIGNRGSLQIYDVEDKTNPVAIGTVDGADEHTISCVLDCKWAYGSEGVVVDLRDPTKPKIAGDWTKGTPVEGAHDVTEVAPGLIVTSSQPMTLLDARKDPAKPELLAVAASKDQRFNHSNLWPNDATDKYLLVGGESIGPQCSDNASSSFMTWDMTNWRKTRTFKMVDQFRLKNGLPTDGDAPTETWCVHWFTTHPDYRNGGLVAIAWYEHGTRILRISNKGKISDDGWFIPFAGQTSAAYWVNDEIIYTADYNRGFDILRYTGKP